MPKRGLLVFNWDGGGVYSGPVRLLDIISNCSASTCKVDPASFPDMLQIIIIVILPIQGLAEGGQGLGLLTIKGSRSFAVLKMTL